MNAATAETEHPVRKLLPPRTPERLDHWSNLLEKAAAFADQEWCQHALNKPPDAAQPERHCAAGLVTRHCQTQEQLLPIIFAIHEQLPLDTTIPEWNDAPERTAEDIRTVFRQAAARLRAEAETRRQAAAG